MASGIPKRAMNTKKKETRKRSWEAGQIRKAKRQEEQEARHKHNVKVGSTGKQRAKEKKNAGSSEDND